MLQSLLWLSLLLHYTSGSIAVHYDDVLKITCDALPCRTVFHDSNCYFAVDAEADPSKTSTKSCSLVLPGAKMIGEAPAPVWTAIDFPEDEFVRLGDSEGKKKAMCLLKGRFPKPVTNSTTKPSGKCKRADICAVEKLKELKITYWIQTPYTKTLKEPIEVGQIFKLKATTSSQPAAWNINFHTKDAVINVAYDIPFHFSVRHDSGYVFLHSLIGGKWVGGVNDEKIPIPNSLKNKAFEIHIRTLEDKFQVFINNEEFCTYKYRMPLASVTHFSMHYGAGLMLHQVQLGAKYDPVPKETGVTTNQFSFCKTLTVSGIIPQGTVRDSINFVRGTPVPWNWPQHEYIVHWNPRYDIGNVMMDTLWNGFWNGGHLGNLVPRGVPFNISFTNQAHGFMILVNGKYYATYNHLICPVLINSIWFGTKHELEVTMTDAENCVVPELSKTPKCTHLG